MTSESKITALHSQIQHGISEVIVGQEDAVEQLCIALLTGGHVLVEGLPGLAKTTLIHAISISLGLDFNRVQFTPDLMPTDLLGIEVLGDQKNGSSLQFEKGPVFTQILHADEINRTPPKTQAALLQAMQEKRVSISGQDHALPEPFFVFATQNPIENEGTYPLPEAQLDRFTFKITLSYPTAEEEARIAILPSNFQGEKVKALESQPDWKAWEAELEEMPITQTVIDAAVKIVRGSRPDDDLADEMIRENVRWGAGPRATQFILRSAKARAALQGRPTPELEDIKKMAYPVLRHRILPSFSAEAKHIDSEKIIAHLIGNLSP
jgi:MoxR-like ATPase